MNPVSAICFRSTKVREIHRVVFAALSLQMLALLPSAAHGAGPYSITYVVSPHPPTADARGSTQVTIRLSGAQGDRSIRFQMAIWSPGDYHAMNHASFITAVTAFGPENHSLDVSRPDGNTWEVATNGSDSVELRYQIPNTPAGYFSDNVTVKEKYAFYNGPATYMYVVGHKTDPAKLIVHLPAGWKRSVAPLDSPSDGSGKPDEVHFTAPDYDTLADSPVVAGDFETRAFEYAGRPHTLVFFDSHQGLDYDAFLPTARKVVAEENRIMGGPPYKQYIFFVDVNGRGGGLEHLNSQRIAFGRSFPIRFASRFIAHEFFHLWNVKRVRPVSLGPFDYVNPPRTRNLWWSEGVTDYFAQISVLRAGLASRQEFLDEEAGSIASLQSVPARLSVTADESSLRVWEANNSSGYGGLSYYSKGQLIGLCLDLKLRHSTGGKSSLDEVMRDLMNRYGLPKPGFPEDGLRDAVVRAGGPEMGSFYDLAARSTQELPFAECLKYAGLRLETNGGGAYTIRIDPAASPAEVALRDSWLTGK